MRLLPVFLIVFSAVNTAAQVKGEPEDIVIGKRLVFRSGILKTDAQLAIALPKNYETSDNRYPVLYVIRDHFLIAAAAVKALSGHRQIPEMIVVAYTNNRMNEVPTTVKGRENMTGGAGDLIRFYKKELIPYIESSYRTEPYRIFFSGSWGALFCIYSVLTDPDFFHAALASGPWFIYDGDERFMLKNSLSFLKKNRYKANFVFFSGGNQPELTPSLEEFVKVLAANAPENLRWEYNPMPNDDHGSIQYKTVFDGLRSLFKPWNTIPSEVAQKGIHAIKEYAEGINDLFGYDLKISEFALMAVGRDLTMQKKLAQSTALFRYLLELYPESHYAWYMIARNCEQAGNTAEAVKNYEKAIALKKKLGLPGFTWYHDYLNAARKKLGK